MKFARYFSVLAALTMLLPLGALAKDKNEATIEIADSVQVGSTQLKPGTYKVQWNGTGQDVQINILRGNKTVATATGKLVEKNEAPSTNAVVLKPLADGSKKMTIDEIDFSKHKEVLVLTSSQMAEK